MGLKINAGKIIALGVKRDQRGNCKKVRVNGEEMKEVDKLNYLRLTISTDGGRKEEVDQRVRKERKLWCTMAKLGKENKLSREVKR